MQKGSVPNLISVTNDYLFFYSIWSFYGIDILLISMLILKSNSDPALRLNSIAPPLLIIHTSIAILVGILGYFGIGLNNLMNSILENRIGKFTIR